MIKASRVVRRDLRSRRIRCGVLAPFGDWKYAVKYKKATITDRDRSRLSRLLSHSDMAGYGSPRARFNLERKLEDAHAVPAENTPRSLVTMNSRIELVEVESGARRLCTLVYPDDKDLYPNSVGVLQHLGQRILGCHEGDIVHAVEDGTLKQFKIRSITYQPEAAGAYQL